MPHLARKIGRTWSVKFTFSAGLASCAEAVDAASVASANRATQHRHILVPTLCVGTRPGAPGLLVVVVFIGMVNVILIMSSLATCSYQFTRPPDPPLLRGGEMGQ